MCLEESLYIHNIRDMKVLNTIRETPPNPAGKQVAGRKCHCLILPLTYFDFILERVCVHVGVGGRVVGRGKEGETPKPAPRSVPSPMRDLVPQPWDHDLS